jgi:glyceraldehyde-3-phosphate dehydrogenase/erythrose-4-phosphate dehydrogenase
MLHKHLNRGPTVAKPTIPTSMAAAKATGLVMPDLASKL